MRFMPENQASGSLPGDWFSGDFFRVSPKSLKINHMPLDIRPPGTADADDIVEVVAWQ